LQDVERFEFQGAPPSGEFLAELQRHDVKIYDGRTWPPQRGRRRRAERVGGLKPAATAEYGFGKAAELVLLLAGLLAMTLTSWS